MRSRTLAARSDIAAVSFILFLIPFAVSVPYALAQTEIPGANTAFSISLSPAQPIPGETVVLTLSSPLYDLTQATITWTAGGKTLAKGEGETTVSVVAPSLGTQTTVTADIVTDTVTAAVDTVIAPSVIDILWESDSYVPPFYTGRSLPSAGARVRLQAIPFLPKKGGGFYSASELSYTWKENGATISNLSGRGKSSAVISSPDLFGNYTISVDVVSPDRSATGAAQILVTSVEPLIRLYRDHPLFGMEYFDALSATTFINENEMTFAAVPYFADTLSTTASHLVYDWGINGKKIPADAARPDEFTINAGATGGLAQIDLSLTDTSNYFVDARGGWAVTFSNGGGSATGTGGGKPADLFHGGQ